MLERATRRRLRRPRRVARAVPETTYRGRAGRRAPGEAGAGPRARAPVGLAAVQGDAAREQIHRLGTAAAGAPVEGLVLDDARSGSRWPPRSGPTTTTTRRPWDHPHVRGDRLTEREREAALAGSPPRAWGQARSGPPGLGVRGITPTCVGTGTTRSSTGLPSRDHPHVRGDRKPVASSTVCGPGSPPRAWGQARRQRQDGPRDGITPTCVGTGGTAGTPTRTCSDHPHVRGDRTAVPSAVSTLTGSPPRAWGQVGRDAPDDDRRGITPTCVGTGSGGRPSRAGPRDHPHVRGDRGDANGSPRLVEGSPPRAWGQATRRSTSGRSRWITPTCVGTGPSARRRGRRPSDHPHVRGDRTHAVHHNAYAQGSPPRAWGQVERAPVEEAVLGITPTCVGTGDWIRSTRNGSRDHPHVRGDREGREHRGRLGPGSPPRAWGQGERRRPGPPAVGITPTCVGTGTRGSSAGARPWDHPHVRGDRVHVPAGQYAVDGSPPRAWGQALVR